MLLDTIQKAIADRDRDLGIRWIDYPLPNSAPDFFSNDYLSLAADPSRRDIFLRRVQKADPTRLFGSTGSRIMTGNSPEINALETAFKRFFGAPSAMLFNSGLNANVAFLSNVPQTDDVVVYDQLVHISCREGIRMSSRASYSFAHNSVASFEECILGVLQKHPQIARGSATVFVVVESLYSMDGDFCSLTEIVRIVETHVPAGRAHIVVDESHTSGICGPNGTGYVAHLGLNDRVHTKLHSLGKAWGFRGGVVLTSPIIRDYLANFAKSIVFSTGMPFTDIYAMEACLSVVSSARGQELRQRLIRLCRYAREKLFDSLSKVPNDILAVEGPDDVAGYSDRGLCSPIIPVLTHYPRKLYDYLLEKGYAPTPLQFPITRSSRIRVNIHAGNTKEEIDAFVNELIAWARQQQREGLSLSRGNAPNGSRKAGESHMETRARL